ncbi:MAG: hypothetical protein HW390_3297 [Candidatus Brocadiaceae bacterium]|nr:hypothetical protein [Candidatus Brocadiaceae bacterium]
MGKQVLEERILCLFSRIEKLLEWEREILEKPVNRKNREELQEISLRVRDTVDSLRVYARYLLFEREVNKRETC